MNADQVWQRFQYDGRSSARDQPGADSNAQLWWVLCQQAKSPAAPAWKTRNPTDFYVYQACGECCPYLHKQNAAVGRNKK